MMVGTIKSVFDDKNGLTKHAVLEPSVDFFKLSHVFVVTEFEEQEE